ncbi:MAG: hypothetical protein R2939_01180 [Kofleriaceae bacterium]
MLAKERRQHRSDNPTAALGYQLEACRESGGLDAMVIADADGLALAAAGDAYVCEEVAGRIVLVGPKIRDFSGTLLDHGQAWDVRMTKVCVDGGELLVCAVGGSAEGRERQMHRGADGARRILRAA